MADTSKKSSLKVSMNYTTFNSPKLHSNAHTFGDRPTRKDIERFWLCSVPTFQFLWHKRPTNRFTQFLEFTKKKARVYADKRKHSVFKAQAGTLLFFCRFEAEILLWLFLDYRENYLRLTVYGGIRYTAWCFDVYHVALWPQSLQLVLLCNHSVS